MIPPPSPPVRSATIHANISLQQGRHRTQPHLQVRYLLTLPVKPILDNPPHSTISKPIPQRLRPRSGLPRLADHHPHQPQSRHRPARLSLPHSLRQRPLGLPFLHRRGHNSPDQRARRPRRDRHLASALLRRECALGGGVRMSCLHRCGG
jgi:hypothetical protein